MSSAAGSIAAGLAPIAVASQACQIISVWCAAASSDDKLTAANCGTLQVTARAVAESLDEAHEAVGDADISAALMYGTNLVHLVEHALWNVCTFGEGNAPARHDLIVTMLGARDVLKREVVREWVKA